MELSNPLSIFEKVGIRSVRLALFLLGGLLIYLTFYFPDFIGYVGYVLFIFAPIWLPIVFFPVFKYMWMSYIRLHKMVHTEHILLEIKLSNDIIQTPKAMELVLNAMYQTGEIDTVIDEYWRGNTRPWFSLEICSFESSVHFFIWTRKRYKDMLEAQIYAHYPSVEIHEVPDYTTALRFDPKIHDLWAIEYKLQKPDVYPIQTYVDWGLDKPAKEEEKVDPISSILEFIGSMGPGEHAWIQIVIRAHRPKFRKKEGYIPDYARWDYLAKEEIKSILSTTATENNSSGRFADLTKGQQILVEAIERSITKKPFDTGIRVMYIWEKDKAEGNKKAGFPTAFRSFEYAAEGIWLNGLKPVFMESRPYPWQDRKGKLALEEKESLYRNYRARGFFYSPFKSVNTFVFNSEELATLYHFPGLVNRTPTLERIPSKRSGAPINLPR